jgi:hypothetical protein
MALALLPLSLEIARWWQSSCGIDDCAVVQVKTPNTGFINSEGEMNRKIMYGISLWAIGETNITALKMSNLGRIR